MAKDSGGMNWAVATLGRAVRISIRVSTVRDAPDGLGRLAWLVDCTALCVRPVGDLRRQIGIFRAIVRPSRACGGFVRMARSLSAAAVCAGWCWDHSSHADAVFVVLKRTKVEATARRDTPHTRPQPQTTSFRFHHDMTPYAYSTARRAMAHGACDAEA